MFASVLHHTDRGTCVSLSAAFHNAKAATPNSAGANLSREDALYCLGDVAHQPGITRIKPVPVFSIERRGDLLRNPPGPLHHEHNSMRQKCCLVNRMRDKHDCASRVSPQAQQIRLQPMPRELVERRKWLVHQRPRVVVQVGVPALNRGIDKPSREIPLC